MNDRLCRATESLININQHGFRPKHNTTTSLMDTLAFIEENIKRTRQVDVVFFDMAKAFDRVDHLVVAKKLAQLATPLPLYQTIMEFITYRKYMLKLDNVVSGFSFTTKSGVPQGSHIGPRIYIWTTNDIVDAVRPCFASVYADDLKTALPIRSFEDVKIMQEAINGLQMWAAENGLEINPSKTRVVSFSVRESIDHGYVIGGQIIQHVNTIRDLGFWWDSKLKMDVHIDTTLAKAKKVMGAGIRVARLAKKRYINKVIYNVYVRPILEYAAPIWAYNAERTKKLDTLMRHVTRWTLGTPKFDIQPGYVNFEERCKILKMDEPLLNFVFGTKNCQK